MPDASKRPTRRMPWTVTVLPTQGHWLPPTGSPLRNFTLVPLYLARAWVHDVLWTNSPPLQHVLNSSTISWSFTKLILSRLVYGKILFTDSKTNRGWLYIDSRTSLFFFVTNYLKWCYYSQKNISRNSTDRYSFVLFLPCHHCVSYFRRRRR